MAQKIKKLSLEQLRTIERLIPVARRKAKAEVFLGDFPEQDLAMRYHYHMDQMAIHEGVRQGKVDPLYKHA